MKHLLARFLLTSSVIYLGGLSAALSMEVDGNGNIVEAGRNSPNVGPLAPVAPPPAALSASSSEEGDDDEVEGASGGLARAPSSSGVGNLAASSSTSVDPNAPLLTPGADGGPIPPTSAAGAGALPSMSSGPGPIAAPTSAAALPASSSSGGAPGLGGLWSWLGLGGTASAGPLAAVSSGPASALSAPPSAAPDSGASGIDWSKHGRYVRGPSSSFPGGPPFRRSSIAPGNPVIAAEDSAAGFAVGRSDTTTRGGGL